MYDYHRFDWSFKVQMGTTARECIQVLMTVTLFNLMLHYANALFILMKMNPGKQNIE